MTTRPSIAALSTLFAACAAIGGCSTMRLEARPNIPQPVIARLPFAVGLYVPIDFANYTYKGERYGFNWEVALGAAQNEGVTRLLTAMFERVVPVDDVATARQKDPAIRAVLEPMLEEYSFVTPRDAGTPFYAVSLKYRVSVYTPDGRLAESWPFTGYGIVPSTGMSAQKPLARATAMAMRDAGAKLVVEFRDQAIIRGLLPDAPQPDTLTAPVAAEPGGNPANPEAVQEGASPGAAPAEQPATPAPQREESPPPDPAPAQGQESAPPAITAPAGTQPVVPAEFTDS